MSPLTHTGNLSSYKGKIILCGFEIVLLKSHVDQIYNSQLEAKFFFKLSEPRAPYGCRHNFYMRNDLRR